MVWLKFASSLHLCSLASPHKWSERLSRHNNSDAHYINLINSNGDHFIEAILSIQVVFRVIAVCNWLDSLFRSLWKMIYMRKEMWNKIYQRHTKTLNRYIRKRCMEPFYWALTKWIIESYRLLHQIHNFIPSAFSANRIHTYLLYCCFELFDREHKKKKHKLETSYRVDSRYP